MIAKGSSEDERLLDAAESGPLANALPLGRFVGSAPGVDGAPEIVPNPLGPSVAGVVCAFCELFLTAVVARNTPARVREVFREALELWPELWLAAGSCDAGGSVVGGVGFTVTGGFSVVGVDTAWSGGDIAS